MTTCGQLHPQRRIAARALCRPLRHEPPRHCQNRGNRHQHRLPMAADPRRGRQDPQPPHTGHHHRLHRDRRTVVLRRGQVRQQTPRSSRRLWRPVDLSGRGQILEGDRGLPLGPTQRYRRRRVPDGLPRADRRPTTNRLRRLARLLDHRARNPRKRLPLHPNCQTHLGKTNHGNRESRQARPR